MSKGEFDRWLDEMLLRFPNTWSDSLVAQIREKVAEAKHSIEDNARYFVNVQLFGGFVTMDIVPLEALKPLFGEFKVPEVKLGGSAPPTNRFPEKASPKREES